MKLSLARKLSKNIPATFINTYMDVRTGRFFQFSGTFTVEGESYSFEGPDEELKQFLADELNRLNYHLYIERHGKDDNALWTSLALVPLSSEEFGNAVYRTIASRGYTIINLESQHLVKVNSKKDVKRSRNSKQAV